MSKIITIPGFKGGKAKSTYDPLDKQTFQTSENLDVFSSPNILTPFIGLANQVFSPDLSTSKVEMFYQASNGTTYWFGDSGTSQQIRIMRGSFPTTPGTITLTTVGTGSSSTSPGYFDDGANDLQGFHHVVELNGYLLFWSGQTLSRIRLSDNTYEENPYTFTVTSNTGHAIFVHQGLRQAFIAVNNIVYRLDSADVSGSAAPVAKLTIDPQYVVKSFCEMGRFVLVGCIAKKDNANSRIFVWDGAALTVDDEINVGDYGLQAIRNVNGTIHILCASVTVGFPQGYVRVYLSTGGAVSLGAELLITPGADNTSQGMKMINLIDDASVDVSGDKLFWAFRGKTQNVATGYLDIMNGVYCYGRFDQTQPRILVLNNTTSTTSAGRSFTCLRIIRNLIYVAFNDTATWYLEHQLANTVFGTKSSRGIYESNIFPLNGGLPGKLKRIVINHLGIPTSCGFTVQIKQFGNYPWGNTVPSADSYQTLFTPEGNSATSGMTQSTDNAMITEIQGNELFKESRFAQIKILYDEVLTTTAPSIVFPILIETI